MGRAKRRPLAGAGGQIRDLLITDYTRNRSTPARITLAILRAGMVLNERCGPRAFALRRVVQIADVVWVRGLMGTEIPTSVRIGPRLRLPHAGRGIMIHPSVSIGAGVTIYHRVSLGVRDDRGGPTIGDDVEIGTGAAILGPVTVARGCRVGANAVVVHDTLPDRNYVGVPARETTRSRGAAR
ncbi:MAG: hypothetical protein Q4P32_10025 [Micrococcales bacterium]|nr:hypothetical protein [Micrococcales bacterium]